MEHPCTQKTAKYGMSLAVITASRLQTECRKSMAIASSVNDMRKMHSIADNPFIQLNARSNYPIQYLSPQSKSLRLSNSCQLRSRMDKKLRRLYKQTRIELPQEQSPELCQLIEAIKNYDEGKEVTSTKMERDVKLGTW